MTWRHISECIPAELMAEIEKMAEAIALNDASAKFVRDDDTPRTQKEDMRRSMPAIRYSAVVIDLGMWKAGRTARGGVSRGPACQRRPGGNGGG